MLVCVCVGGGGGDASHKPVKFFQSIRNLERTKDILRQRQDI